MSAGWERETLYGDVDPNVPGASLRAPPHRAGAVPQDTSSSCPRRKSARWRRRKEEQKSALHGDAVSVAKKTSKKPPPPWSEGEDAAVRGRTLRPRRRHGVANSAAPPSPPLEIADYCRIIILISDYSPVLKSTPRPIVGTESRSGGAKSSLLEQPTMRFKIYSPGQ